MLPPYLTLNEEGFQSWGLPLHLENAVTDMYLRYNPVMWEQCSRYDQINELDLNTEELVHVRM